MSAESPARRRALFSSLLESRRMCACIVGAGAAHVALTAAGLPGWPCPILQATGLLCPGCGLGKACALLLRGEWAASLQTHAFAPFIVAALILLIAGAALPPRPRGVLIAVSGSLEQRLPFTAALLVGAVIYWILRFALDGPRFIPLGT